MSFRKFFRKRSNENRDYMALGLSKRQLDLPISDSMAYLVSLLPQDSQRVAALRWLHTDGLVQASKGRDELLKLYQQKSSDSGRNLPLATKNPNIPSGRNVAGMKKEAFGDNLGMGAYSAIGSLPEKSSDLTSADLFSPEGREFHNISEQDAQWIDQTYAEQFEPKIMSINSRGKWYDADLNSMRETMRSKGLPEFTYGGPNGYIQFVEQGSWMPEHERSSSADPRQQHGPDLRNAESDYHDGEPTVKFQGGTRGLTAGRKYSGPLRDMRHKFNRLHSELIQDTPVEADQTPDQKMLLKLDKDLKRIEKNVGTGNERGDAFRAFGAPGPGRGEGKQLKMGGSGEYLGGGWVPPPPPGVDQKEYVDYLKKVIKAGLSSMEFSIGRPEDYENPDGVASFRVSPKGAALVKLTPEQQQRLWDSITKATDHGAFEIRGRWPHIIGQETGLGKTPRGKETKWIISSIIKKGAKEIGLDKELKHVYHQIQGDKDDKGKSKPLEAGFMKQVKSNMFPFSQVQPDLVQAGYKFSRVGSQKDIMTAPEKPIVAGHFVLGADKYRVLRMPELDLNDPKAMVVELPDNFSLDDKIGMGHTGPVMHTGKDVVSSGDPNLGGQDTQPAHSKEEVETLIRDLMQGKYGEPDGPHANEFELPTVKIASKRGVGWAARKAMIPTSYTKNLDRMDLMAKALEGLRNFTGHHAFRFGYVTDKELMHALSTVGSPEEELEKERNPEWIIPYSDGSKRQQIKVSASSKEEAIAIAKQELGNDARILTPKRISGKGIRPIMHGKGITDPEEQSGHIEKMRQVVQQLNKGVSPEDLGVPPKAIEAFGDNAFEARLRYVSQYVSNAVIKSYKGEGGEEKTGQDFVGDEGKSVGYEDRGSQVKGDRGEYEAEGDPTRFSPQTIASDLGAEKITSSAPQQLEKPTGAAGFGAKAPVPAAPAPAPAPSPIPPTAAMPQTGAASFGAKPSASPLGALVRKKKGASGFGKSPGVTESKFTSFQQWKEMAGTGAVYDGTKPKDGGGFNWWGSAGHPLGVSIGGDADTSKEDPTGKGKNGRRRKKK